MVKISIITINYNDATGLEKTMQSVFAQTYNKFEYIVIDGNSTDNSKQIIRNFEGLISSIQLKWISEADNGIYNAMNKGIKRSTGDFLLFLNSGDVLYDAFVIENCVKQIDSNCDLCSGILILEGTAGRITLYPPKELGLYQSVYKHLTHPNTFIKKTLFDQFGLYNEDNKIVSDWEFFFVVSGLNKCKYRSLNVPIAIFYEDGVSSSNNELQEREKSIVLKNNLSDVVLKELEERHYLESLLAQSCVKNMNRLKKNMFLFKIANRFLKVLNKFVR